jgi:hypothetical protein
MLTETGRPLDEDGRAWSMTELGTNPRHYADLSPLHLPPIPWQPVPKPARCREQREALASVRCNGRPDA